MTYSPQKKLTPQEQQERWRLKSQRKAEAAFKRLPILVYTMGKVGSLTVYQSLRAAGLDNRVFHIHSLCPDHVANGRKKLESEEAHIPRILYESRAIIEQLRMAPSHPVKIISLIRNPLAREVSELFENGHRAQHRYILREDGTFDVDKVVNHLLVRMARPTPCKTFQTWFQREPEQIFGIDILATPFDKERGWQVYQQGAAELLLIRLEDLSRVGSQAITEFLGEPKPIEMIKSHVRKDETYAQIQKTFKAPRAVCEQLYRTPLVKHIYTADQRTEMIGRWSPSDETPEQSEQRVLAALLGDIEARDQWMQRETARLKADRAAARRQAEKRELEIDQLRAKVAERLQCNDAKNIPEERNGESLDQTHGLETMRERSPSLTRGVTQPHPRNRRAA